jgi:hypothetical protein
MGIPIALLTNSTPSSHRKYTSNSNDGRHSSSFVLFENAQQHLKQDVLAVVKTMFYSIHLKTHLEEYLENTEPKKWSAEEAAKSAEVSIELPSLPDEDKLLDFYHAGFLKYDALIKYLSTKHGITEDSWNTEVDPPITPEMKQQMMTQQQKEKKQKLHE